VDCPTSTKFSAKIVRTAITVRDASFWMVFTLAVIIGDDSRSAFPLIMHAGFE
jgi:hypothetical protein